MSSATHLYCAIVCYYRLILTCIGLSSATHLYRAVVCYYRLLLTCIGLSSAGEITVRHTSSISKAMLTTRSAWSRQYSGTPPTIR